MQTCVTLVSAGALVGGLFVLGPGRTPMPVDPLGTVPLLETAASLDAADNSLLPPSVLDARALLGVPITTADGAQLGPPTRKEILHIPAYHLSRGPSALGHAQPPCARGPRRHRPGQGCWSPAFSHRGVAPGGQGGQDRKSSRVGAAERLASPHAYLFPFVTGKGRVGYPDGPIGNSGPVG